MLKAKVSGLSGLLLSVSVGVFAAPVGSADPFSPAEQQYLADIRPNLQSDYQEASKSNAEVVNDGWWACHDHAVGVSPEAAGISPVVDFWAGRDLCPHGCPQGCPPR